MNFLNDLLDYVSEKVMGDWYAFVTIGICLFILSWLFFLGDLVSGR